MKASFPTFQVIARPARWQPKLAPNAA